MASQREDMMFLIWACAVCLIIIVCVQQCSS